MEHAPSQQYEHEIPEEAPALADWIEEELGDIELAQFLRDHPEGLELCANGGSILPRTVFDLEKDVSDVVPEYQYDLRKSLALDGTLPVLTYDRFVGDATQSMKALIEMSHRLEVGRSRIEFWEGESVEKTEGQLAMIAYANDVLDVLRKGHGLDSFTIPNEAIRITDEVFTRNRLNKGEFALFDQCAHVLKYTPWILSHEMVHAKSYAAVRVEKKTEGALAVQAYRMGLLIIESDEPRKEKQGREPLDFLRGLNEAVTEETTSRLVAEMPEDHPVLGEIAQWYHHLSAFMKERKQNLLREWNARPYWITNEVDNLDGTVTYTSAYTRERNLMFDLFHKLYERAPDRFAGKTEQEAEEELFLMLQKAMFTGNILPFGRLFNETFGRGKFREYGHLQENDEIAEFIADL